ncbi:hypothetical protein Ccrd_008974 [Cynara cardunculus var. scolymus]|uniref:Lipase, GDSL n=1 Tax=Cynara cardunculus var. scolymus TaxID=59895 RepID=A0A103XE25_CYNCS|nr:hypothetical protein Ccrd_008974 [Cynara cardunculus var. scolymus]
MNLLMLRRFWVVPAVVTVALSAVLMCEAGCGYEAIFNFGDSNSDTGGFWSAFPAQRLGIPLVSPYLKSIGSDYKHGVNFATLASTVLLPQTSLFVSGLSPFALPIQLNQMKNFKAQVDQLYDQGSSNLPPPDIFGKSLYTFYIGQNDFTSNLAKGIDVVKPTLPQVISQITSTIKADIDEFGCMIPFNNAVVEYNKMLHDALNQTGKELSDANVIYVDSHKVLLKLFRHPASHGLKYGTLACCGNGGGPYNYNPKVFCGNNKVVNGQNITASACGDPENYVSWDGVHTTEAANKIIVDAILGDGFTNPPFEIKCT